LLCITWGAFAQEYVPYIPEDQLPDVVACIPAPPSMKSAEFKFDAVRYKWGKQQRKDPARLEMAIRDAIWNKHHHGPAVPEEMEENWNMDDEMFVFRKEMTARLLPL